MRRFFSSFFVLFVFSMTIMAQRMSDDQVIQYVKEAAQQGKSQSEMQTELLRRGVTYQQYERIKKQYSGSQQGSTNQQGQATQQRQRSSTTTDNAITNPRGNSNVSPLATQQNSGLLTPGTTNDVNTPYTGQEDFMNLTLPQIQKPGIFGMNFFSNDYLSFEPNSNIATPANYRFGPGDEVIIDIWGNSQNTIRQVISPDGTILLEGGIGPVYLSGKSFNEATNILKRVLSTQYSESEITVSLGQNRSIQVNIMGEVLVPGTYTLSSFASVFHALYSAGGITPIGSLRDIQVVRKGKVIANVDVYDYLMYGKTDIDIRLMEDDVILVNPYESLVNIAGNVKRPMAYEMKNGETISTLLKFSGSFAGNAYSKNIRVIRLSSGSEKQIYNVDQMDYSVFQLQDGDSLYVEAVLDRFENMVQISGAVYREGMYQMNGGVNSVKLLIQKAEGLRGDAYLERAQLQRQRDDLSLELVPVDLRGIINGTVADIPLQKNDILYIPSINDLQEEKFLTIHGEVAYPGTYIYADNVTVNDLVIQAGGLLEGASTARVDVSRRIKDPKSSLPGNAVGESFSFELKNGYLLGDKDNFTLAPFDEVYIRKSPVYHAQQNVAITGEVIYGGNYALSKKNERISDLVNRAGGITEDAYIKGARLMRRMTEEEILRKQDALRMAQAAADSISMQTLDLATTYPVGIDLREALSKPGSDADLVLREGDELIIPEYLNTVKINGAVMYPNTVLYRPGESLKYYIEQAGGYGNLAKKRKAYVVYMNGTVARLRSGNSKGIEPGCEIIIPSKEERRRMSTGEIIGIGTSVASLATMVATLVNLISK